MGDTDIELGRLDRDLWAETLVFPDPTRLDDDGMEYHFREYDGRWSYQTKRAMKAFDASGLQLNSNWALESQSWRCPACQRPKHEVFRKSPSGILLAKLELHHDHMADEVIKRPVEVAGPEWKALVGEGSAVVLDTICSLIIRFDQALICSECNAADGKVKQMVGADPRFTFTVAEIGQFVRSEPHKDHQVDAEIAKRLWEDEKPAFHHRLELLKSLVTDLLEKRLKYRPEGVVPRGRPMFDRCGPTEALRNAFNKSARGTQNHGMLHSIRADFLSRSVSNDVPKRAPVLGSRNIPTDEEYATFVPTFGLKKWNELDHSWKCPCCGRGKRDSMRMSSKRRWTAQIQSVEQYDILSDADEIRLRERLFPDFPNEMHLTNQHFVDVCSDCANITVRLGQARSDLPYIFLTVDEMRSVLSEVSHHVPHVLDFERGGELLMANLRYRQSVEAMSAFNSLREEFRFRIKWAMEVPAERDRRFKDLDFRLEVQHGIGDPQERKLIMRIIKDGDFSQIRKVTIWR